MGHKFKRVSEGLYECEKCGFEAEGYVDVGECQAPPLPADAKPLRRFSNTAKNYGNDLSEEFIVEKLSERIFALEALAKQMADCLETHGLRSAIWFLEGPYFEPPCKEAADEIRKMLDAYKRGING